MKNAKSKKRKEGFSLLAAKEFRSLFLVNNHWLSYFPGK